MPPGCSWTQLRDRVPHMDAPWLMKVRKLIIMVASRRPAIEIAGYTYKVPLRGTPQAPYTLDRDANAYSQSAAWQTSQRVARDFNRRASAGTLCSLFRQCSLATWHHHMASPHGIIAGCHLLHFLVCGRLMPIRVIMKLWK
jgi:hypothetical protein